MTYLPRMKAMRKQKSVAGESSRRAPRIARMLADFEVEEARSSEWRKTTAEPVLLFRAGLQLNLAVFQLHFVFNRLTVILRADLFRLFLHEGLERVEGCRA